MKKLEIGKIYTWPELARMRISFKTINAAIAQGKLEEVGFSASIISQQYRRIK